MMIRSEFSSARTGNSERDKIRQESYTYYMLCVKEKIPPDVHKLADLCILNFLAVQTWPHLVIIRFLQLINHTDESEAVELHGRPPH